MLANTTPEESGRKNESRINFALQTLKCTWAKFFPEKAKLGFLGLALIIINFSFHNIVKKTLGNNH